MYHVLDNKKPATLPRSKETHWHNNQFATLDEAVVYANDWLGAYGPFSGEHLLKGVTYSEIGGIGDTVKIVHEETVS